MKKHLTLGAALLAAAMSTAAVPTDSTYVTWTSLGTQTDAQGNHYVERIVVTGNTDFKKLAFNRFARKSKMLNPLDTLHEVVPGYYYITSARFGTGADSVVIDIDTRGRLVNRSYAPDGFHRVLADGSTAPVSYTRTPITRPEQWRAGTTDPMPYGPAIYDFNASLASAPQPGVYDIIPSFKKVTLLPGGGTCVDPTVDIVIDDKYAVEGRPEHVTLRLADNKLTIRSASAKAAASAQRVFTAKVLRPNAGQPLPDAEFVYDPDFQWRGMMIDISRNFQTLETLEDILHLMADNGLNHLHFHPVDDEAWRIELPSLPELTAVGGRRGWGTDEHDHLYQIFTGDGNPDNLNNSSNGYLTRDQFIHLLRTANDLGITVITEIESPGHARAARLAMERRAANGDPSYRLVHDGDTSRYTSAQSFHDNVMNPALESTYKFMETVFDDIIDIYREAGAPLEGIHIGGDEVAKGAWNGSDVARKFMADNNITDQHQLHAYFVRRVAKILADRNIPVYGWQEIALGHGDEYNTEIAPLTGGVDCWSTIVKKGDTPVPVRSVMNGYPTLLSNVEHLYFDLSYSAHPEEPGLNWGGHVNEFTAFDTYADQICPIPDGAKGKVIGLNAHCFSETLRNPDQLFMYLTPKIFGLAERAAHTDTTYTVAMFNRIIGDKELPALQKRYAKNHRGTMHINQPGIKIIDGMVHMNAPYNGGEIHFTTDGTEPTADSPLYTTPFATDSCYDIRARYFRNGAASVTTYMPTVVNTAR